MLKSFYLHIEPAPDEFEVLAEDALDVGQVSGAHDQETVLKDESVSETVSPIQLKQIVVLPDPSH